MCVWLRLSASAHSPLIAGLTVTTLLHTSGLYTEGRRIGENTGAGTQLTYRAIDNLPPLHQNIGEGREEGGRERRKRGRRRRRGKKKKENPENSSLANVVKPSGWSSFALEEQRRKRTLNEKKARKVCSFFPDSSSVLEVK